MRKKKKFFETGVGKVLKGAASIVAPGLVTALESVSTVGEAIEVINGSSASPEDKHRLTEILLKADKDEAGEITQRWQSDALGGSWLAANVRPIVFLALFCFLVLFTLLDSFELGFHIQESWINLWTTLGMTVFAGYFGARTVEKYHQRKHK